MSEPEETVVLDCEECGYRVDVHKDDLDREGMTIKFCEQCGEERVFG